MEGEEKRQADDSMDRPKGDHHRLRHAGAYCRLRPMVAAELDQAKVLAMLLTRICHPAQALQEEETAAVAAKVEHTSPSTAACRCRHKSSDSGCVYLEKVAGRAVWVEEKHLEHLLVETCAAKVSHHD